MYKVQTLTHGSTELYSEYFRHTGNMNLEAADEA